MRDEFKNTDNWHKRGYLPHYNAAEKYQFLTYRLEDSLPRSAFSQFEQKAYKDLTSIDKTEKRRYIEKILDKGYGSCFLANPICAEIIVNNWKYFDKGRYDLIAYTVMPNHVHILIKTYPHWELGSLVKTWKSFTAKAMRKHFKERLEAEGHSTLPGILTQGQTFWQREYWDRFIRDENHFQKSICYIHENPVKAGLCQTASDWKWSSINDL